MFVNAVILAGGSPAEPLAAAAGVASKTLVPINGRPMVDFTLQALRDSGGIERLIYVGPAAELQPQPDVMLKDQGSLLGNLEAGMNAAGSGRILVASGDNPFITSEAVVWLLQNAPDAALVYPIVPKEAVEARWPGMRRTYARLRDGTFTGGNLIIIDRDLFARALPMARKIIDLRKKPLALARLIGVGVLIKLLLGRLTIAEMEKRAERLFGVPMRALITPYPEVGVDVDSEEDFAWLEVKNDAHGT